MACLAVTEYSYHKWQRICSVFVITAPTAFSFMNCHRVCNKSNTTGATNETGIAYTSGAYEFPPPRFCWIRDAQIFVLCVVVLYDCLSCCPLSCGHCNVWYTCLRFTASDYLFGIFKHFFLMYPHHLNKAHKYMYPFKSFDLFYLACMHIYFTKLKYI
jgi:hypothetical protein